MRKAIFQSIDRTQINRIHFNGLDYDAPPAGELQLLPATAGYTDVVSKVIPFDPQQAREDLDAAGWVPGPDGVRAKGGQPLAIDYVYFGDDAAIKAVAAATAAMLKEVGVRLQIRQMPSSDYSKIVTGKEFDMMNSGVTQTDPFGIAYICQTYCSNSTLINRGQRPRRRRADEGGQHLPDRGGAVREARRGRGRGPGTYGILPAVNTVEIWAVKTGLANFGSYRFALVPPETIGWERS